MTTKEPAFPPLSFRDRLRAMIAVVIIGVLLLAGASRWILAPSDPSGCVGVLSSRLGWWMIPASIVLGAPLAALICWISGAKLEEMGVFGVALGFALASLRYNDATYMWDMFGGAEEEGRQWVALNMLLESIGWFLVILGAYIASRVAINKLKLDPFAKSNPFDEYRRGALTVVFMSLIALLLIPIFYTGTEFTPIRSGQVCFACALAFYLAALVGYQLSAAHSPAWSCLAVGVVAVTGYAWTFFHPTPIYPGRAVAHLSHFAPTSYGAALPIQMVMVSTVAAIFGNWHQRQLTRYALVEEGAA